MKLFLFSPSHLKYGRAFAPHCLPAQPTPTSEIPALIPLGGQNYKTGDEASSHQPALEVPPDSRTACACPGAPRAVVTANIFWLVTHQPVVSQLWGACKPRRSLLKCRFQKTGLRRSALSPGSCVSNRVPYDADVCGLRNTAPNPRDSPKHPIFPHRGLQDEGSPKPFLDHAACCGSLQGWDLSWANKSRGES